MSELENRLDDLMRDRELTLTELSEMTEMNISQLCKYWKGDATPNVYSFKKIVSALQLDAEETFWLLFGRENGRKDTERRTEDAEGYSDKGSAGGHSFSRLSGAETGQKSEL